MLILYLCQYLRYRNYKVRMTQDRTHDISFTDYHIKDLETFGKTVEEAANAAFPILPSRYSEVHVLLLSWEHDPLGVITEIRDLRTTFERDYRYVVEEWQMPGVHAQNALRKRINRFLDDYDELEDSLLIIYYGGRKFSSSNEAYQLARLLHYWISLSDFK